ncbi:hypothetical protein T459_20797 [Capsicum annuum]|uniref:Uncharacterized protein n=1 Tax=Capsicum annuum TaxID=4072 RepID=A0A1U8FDV7_CAPAN|nr:uncharacterized protein LOC107856381 [Capsicum annuum]XP_016556890.1 uncharacterized protein LOC107856381 [Capsicum annuum]XP_047249294.1 uncharacterized protein LOC107856381 [Capsicum annuum]XP_047249295.1 uncharacterized protein LOC107856381 [Capsicum annuum]KAF3626874.1 putative protein phosphatase 2C 55-like [Capsicum annuum]PHT77275.1 hypothetical protein T459_20797 [Capsicum annuum]
MVQTLESIRGGGGSIKVGTTGTVSALMSRELDSKPSTSTTSVSCRYRSPTVCSFSTGDATSPKRTKPRTSIDEASSSWASEDNKNGPEIVRKAKHYNCKTPQIPILESENISVDRTSIRRKPNRKGPTTLVEIVDIKCGSVEKTRARPMKNRLKKLGFSKLSETPV